MCSTPANGTVEAYKSVIDFNKTIISISSAILTALIAYLVYQKIEFRVANYVSLTLLVLSIVLSIAGFGKAIKTVKDAQSRKGTIALSNIGAYALIAGILAILAIKNDEKTIDGILTSIENSTITLNKRLMTKNCTGIELKSKNYILNYKTDSTNTEVIYSTEENKIISIK